MTRKVLVCLLIVLFTLALPAGAALSAEQYGDMPNNWSTKALENAVNNGLLGGIDGKIMPDGKLTRAQMAAVINRAFGAVNEANISTFTDVSKTNWFFNDMAKAVQMGTFKGSNNKLYPNQAISREEAFVVLARAFKLSNGNITTLNQFSDKAQISSWAAPEIAALVEAGYVEGSNGKLAAKNSITRAEFAQLMDNTLTQYIKTAGTYTEVATGNIMINAAGVTLKDLTIKGDLIIGDGVGEGNVTLNNVTVNGRTVIRGGGVNSVIIIGTSKIPNVIISKVDGHVRIATEDDVEIETLFIDDGKDDVILEGSFTNVTLSAGNVPVIVQNATIGQITMAAEEGNITIAKTATVQDIKLNPEAQGCSLAVAGTVTNIVSEAPKTTLSVSGTVTSVTATATACNASIDACSGSQIGSVSTCASCTNITGTGTVTKVEAQAGAQDVKIETPKTQIVVGAGVTGVTGAGGTQIAAGSTANNNTTGTGVDNPTAPSSGSGSSTPTVNISNVVVNSATSLSFVSTTLNSLTLGNTVIALTGTTAPYALYNAETSVYTVTLDVHDPLLVGNNTITATKTGYHNGTGNAVYNGVALGTHTIQEAIDATASGETIVIPAGTYNENLQLAENDTVFLKGAGNSATIIQPAENTNAINIGPSSDVISNNVFLKLNDLQISVSGTGRGINAYDLTNSSIILENSVINYSETGRGISLGCNTNSNHNAITLMHSNVTCPTILPSTTSNRAISYYYSANSTLDIISSTVEAKHYALNLNSEGLTVNINASNIKGYAALNLFNTGSTINIDDSTIIGRTFSVSPITNSFGAIVFQEATNTVANITNSTITNEFINGATSDECLIELRETGNSVYLDTATQLVNTNENYAPIDVKVASGNQWFINNVEQTLATVPNLYVNTAIGNDTNNGAYPSTAFETIQAAINAATAGDVIYIKAGTYTEKLTVSTGITLNAETGVTLNAGNPASDIGITVMASNAVINGFTITNSYAGVFVSNNATGVMVSNNTISASANGIVIHKHADDATITGNTITGVLAYGIAVGYDDDATTAFSSGVTVENNTITNAGIDGIYADYLSCDNNYINNIITGSGRNGIHLYKSHNDTVEDNTITGSTANGISLMGSYLNYIADNTISDNTSYGIQIRFSWGTGDPSDNGGNQIISNIINNNNANETQIYEERYSDYNNEQGRNIATGNDFGTAVNPVVSEFPAESAILVSADI